MGQPKVSVIIPVYNSGKFLRQSIDCVLNQTWANLEVIIVDDGSTDDSKDIAESYEDERIIVISKLNGGASSARNAGLKIAEGDIIQFLDGDDILPLDKIQKQMEILIKNPDCIVGCHWVRFRQDLNNQFGAIGPDISIQKTLSPLEWLTTYHTMLVQCWLTPRKLIEHAGFWDERLSFNDDGEYFARVVAAADKVLFCNNTIGYYRTENYTSVSTLNSYEKFQSAYYSAQSFEKVLTKLSQPTSELSRHIGNRYKEILYLCYPQYPELVKKCLAHPEIKAANSQFETGGMFNKLISKYLGWKAVRLIKHYILS